MQHPALAHHRDDGGIITGWLIKVTVVLGVAGLVLFDAVSIGSTAMGVSDTAGAAARDAAEAVEAGGDTRLAYPAAVTTAVEQNALNEVDPADVRIATDGSATVTVARTAPTLVVARIPWIAGWAHRSATDTAAPVS
ncbi:hypothetical protein GCM10028777_09370 [Angustibacter speluncae]